MSEKPNITTGATDLGMNIYKINVPNSPTTPTAAVALWEGFRLLYHWSADRSLPGSQLDWLQIKNQIRVESTCSLVLRCSTSQDIEFTLVDHWGIVYNVKRRRFFRSRESPIFVKIRVSKRTSQASISGLRGNPMTALIMKREAQKTHSFLSGPDEVPINFRSL